MKPRDGTGNAHIALLVVQVLFGLLPVLAKLAFRAIDPLPLTTIRTIGAALCLLALHPLLVRNPIPLRREGKTIALLALVGVVLNQALFVTGLERTSAVNASLVITTIPVFTYTIAVTLGREQLGPRRALGIGLALTGVLYLIGLDGYHIGKQAIIGDLLVAANCFFFSLFLVLSKPLAQRYDPLSLTTWTFVAGSLILLPIGLATGMTTQALQASQTTWLLVAMIILGPTLLTYLLNNRALRVVPSSTVAVYIYLQPIVSAIAAALALDAKLDVKLVPAAVLVFAGVWLVARRRRGIGGDQITPRTVA